MKCAIFLAKQSNALDNLESMSQPIPLARDKSYLVKCQCGCGGEGSRFRMRTITPELHRTDGQSTRVLMGARIDVLPACESSFKRELAMMVKFDELINQLPVAWWKRLPHARAIYSAQFSIMKRTKKNARALARRVAILTVSPDWLANLLVQWWKTGRSQAPAAAESRA